MSRLPEVSDRLGGRHAAHDRQVEDRSRGRPHGLRVVDIDGGGREHDAVGARCVRRAHDRARRSPGSRTSCRIETQPPPPSASRPTSRNGATPTMPCGVTVDVSLVDDRARPRARPRRRRSAGCARRTRADRPRRRGVCSARRRLRRAPRERPARPRRGTAGLSRKARLCSRAAAATFGFLALEITTRPRDAGRPESSPGCSADGGASSGGRRLRQRVLRLLHELGEGRSGRARRGRRGSCGRPRRPRPSTR